MAERTRRTAWGVIALVVCACTVACGPPLGGPGGDLPHLASSPTGKSAARIQKIGQSHYPGVYTGVVAEPSRTVVLFIDGAADSTAFLSKVRSLVPDRVSLYVERVPRSYRQLHALTLRIAKDRHSLVKQGVHLQSWGPQPSSGSLVIVLTRPPHSTTPSRQYYFYAARILQDRYGDAVTVNPIVQTPLHADSG